VSVTAKVVVADSPAAAILQEAAPPHFDLIAMQTHGRHGMSRLMLGSVADKVVRGASVPVLVQRPRPSRL
jgi:nucleotide-binding universal stress UspA family protein